MKPIFIIKIPRIPELHDAVRKYVDGSELTVDYHVFMVAYSKDDIEFECFNSPYKPEEFAQLTQLIEKINKENETTSKAYHN
jgi:hypothetical protein